jgi:hypothetical protein
VVSSRSFPDGKVAQRTYMPQLQRPESARHPDRPASIRSSWRGSANPNLIRIVHTLIALLRIAGRRIPVAIWRPQLWSFSFATESSPVSLVERENSNVVQTQGICYVTYLIVEICICTGAHSLDSFMGTEIGQDLSALQNTTCVTGSCVTDLKETLIPPR